MIRRWLRRLAILTTTVAVLALSYFVLCVAAALQASYPLDGTPSSRAGWVKGAFHVHSTASDGRGSLAEIALAAENTGLDFVVITDHNVLSLTAARYERGVLLIPGVELSTRFGHLLAFGLSRVPTVAERDSAPFTAVASQGGISFLAHPIQKKSPWTDWEGASAASGLELYSADTMFREAQARPFSRALPSLAAYLVDPIHALMLLATPAHATQERLLALSTPKRPMVALCSHDAHGLPPYEWVFRALALYLPGPALPEDAGEASSWVIRTLAEGRAHCGFRAFGDASGFELRGLEPKLRQAPVGTRVDVVLPSPAPAEVGVNVRGPAKLLPGARAIVVEGAGPIHVEVWAQGPGPLFDREWRPWLVPSPFIGVVNDPQ